MAWDSAWTDETGHYQLSATAGTYALHFDAEFSTPLAQSAWFEGTELPAGPTSPGVFDITTPVEVVKDKTLAKPQVATGTITADGGQPLGSASVSSYAWDPMGGDGTGGWSQVDAAQTGADGAFQIRIPSDTTLTFGFSRRGFTTEYLGGGTELPAAPNGTNSVTTNATDDEDLGTIALALRPSTLGTVAGQNLDYCLNGALEANDDGSSAPVDIPFDLKFFGSPYEQLFVNNNGNVTFGDSLSQYTPEDLTGATGLPIIAPFFADVDTRPEESNVVTYGTSPDGTRFCVNWADVGYYSGGVDKLNTFQLILTKSDTGAGRVAGDFDITFNYDRIQWESGDASDGTGGLGGTSAAAGFSAGTGDPGTFVQLPGSLVNGALLDGGPNALITGRQNSTQDGRYRFEVRNDGIVSSLGNLQGTVTDTGGNPIGDAWVTACRTSGTRCGYTETSPGGGYSFTALPAGEYSITADPTSGDYFSGGTTATVAGGETTIVAPIVLAAPRPMPPGTTLNGEHSSGVPSVYYGEPVQLALDGCAAVTSPAYTVTLADGTEIAAGPLTEAPAGHYTATIPQFYPNHGEALISTNVPITCGGEPVAFNVYIDPSGIVTDQYGVPVPGATVTLLRENEETLEFEAVPDGSPIMSPSNRTNPDTTDDVGFFRWDVSPGVYKVKAEATGCTAVTTDAMEVPPERLDLLIKMQCTRAAPDPTALPRIQGKVKVGKKITVVPADWADPLATASTQLLRNGRAVTLGAGNSYLVKAADVGKTLVAKSTGKRPDYVQENGTGATVTFTGTSVQTTGVKVPKMVSKTTIAGKQKIQRGKAVALTITVKGIGIVKPTGVIKVFDGAKLVKKIKMIRANRGKVIAKVVLRTRGKHKMKATYGGNAKIRPSKSPVLTVTAT